MARIKTREEFTGVVHINSDGHAYLRTVKGEPLRLRKWWGSHKDRRVKVVVELRK